jgi:isopentenyl phosphate kinase
MKQFKLTITINERGGSTTITSTHKEHEIMNDIIKETMKECHIRPQKYIIVLHGGKDNGSAKLSAYNEKMLKHPINVVLEECFSDKGNKKLNTPVITKSCHEDSEDQYCGRGYPRNDKGCKGCLDWF